MKLCRCHISHATDSVRVENMGMGPCWNIATIARISHSGSHDHWVLRSLLVKRINQEPLPVDQGENISCWR